MQMTQAPVLRKPANVADFPAKRVDGVEARPHELFIAEVGYKLERALARLAKSFDKFIC